MLPLHPHISMGYSQKVILNRKVDGCLFYVPVIFVFHVKRVGEINDYKINLP